MSRVWLWAAAMSGALGALIAWQRAGTERAPSAAAQRASAEQGPGEAAEAPPTSSAAGGVVGRSGGPESGGREGHGPGLSDETRRAERDAAIERALQMVTEGSPWVLRLDLDALRGSAVGRLALLGLGETVELPPLCRTGVAPSLHTVLVHGAPDRRHGLGLVGLGPVGRDAAIGCARAALTAAGGRPEVRDGGAGKVTVIHDASGREPRVVAVAEGGPLLVGELPLYLEAPAPGSARPTRALHAALQRRLSSDTVASFSAILADGWADSMLGAERAATAPVALVTRVALGARLGRGVTLEASVPCEPAACERLAPWITAAAAELVVPGAEALAGEVLPAIQLARGEGELRLTWDLSDVDWSRVLGRLSAPLGGAVPASARPPAAGPSP